MFVIKHKIVFFFLSAILVIGSIVGFATQGFDLSIEFTGGSVMELSYATEEVVNVHDAEGVVTGEPAVLSTRPAIDELQAAFAALELPGTLQPFGDYNVVVRTRDLSEEERVMVIDALSLGGEEAIAPSVERFNSIGPSIGKELRSKALLAIIIVAFAIILFVAYAFRHKDSDDDGGNKNKRVGPTGWLFGLIAVVALVHDVIIPAGVFVWAGLEVNTLFVVGILSILGLSVNDTIVVFDRIRENLRDNEQAKHDESFAVTVGRSLRQTVARSINTSLTLVVVLLALYVVGPESTRDLALVMFVGTLVGTYSSIFLASPLLVLLHGRRESKKS